jgi:hypothetical protein
MHYFRITLATIEVSDHAGLRAAWRLHGCSATLVDRFVVRKPLTERQIRRLPKDLRELLG